MATHARDSVGGQPLRGQRGDRFRGKLPQLPEQLRVVSQQFAADLGAWRFYRGLDRELHRRALANDPDVRTLGEGRPPKILPDGARAPAMSHEPVTLRDVAGGSFGQPLALELLDAAGEWVKVICELHEQFGSPTLRAALPPWLPRDLYGPLGDVARRLVLPAVLNRRYWRDNRPPRTLAGRVVAELTAVNATQILQRARYEQERLQQHAGPVVDPDAAVHTAACQCGRCVKQLTRDEMALLRLTPSDPLPSGGQVLSVVVRSGTGTAVAWTSAFGPAFRERFGVALSPGSLNLWTDTPVRWESPAVYTGEAIVGEFCPVILAERAVGVAFRRNEATPTFLEVLSPVRLRSRLNDVADEERIMVRLLPGDLLG